MKQTSSFKALKSGNSCIKTAANFKDFKSFSNLILVYRIVPVLNIIFE